MGRAAQTGQQIFDSMRLDPKQSFPLWVKIVFWIVVAVVVVMFLIPLFITLMAMAEIGQEGSKVFIQALSWLDKNLKWVLPLVLSIYAFQTVVMAAVYMDKAGYFESAKTNFPLSKQQEGVPQNAAQQEAMQSGLKAGTEAVATQIKKRNVDTGAFQRVVNNAVKRTTRSNKWRTAFRNRQRASKQAEDLVNSRVMRDVPA